MGHWNIQGLTENVDNAVIIKLLESDFAKVFKKLDLFCLSETHIGPDFNFVLFKTTTFTKVTENSVLTTAYSLQKLIKDGVKTVKNFHQDII